MREHEIYHLIAKHLQENYPDVIYRFDLAADLKLTIGQARKHKTLHPHRGYPDLFIAQPRLYWSDLEDFDGDYGLYLEIKKDGETLYPGPRAKKRFKSLDGNEYKTEHLMEQADVLFNLRQAGYAADFAIGFDEAVEIIDEYLGGKK